MMKTTGAITLAAIGGFSLTLAATTPVDANRPGESAAAKPTRVVLIGASIGQEWELANLPARTHDAKYAFEALQAWQFDKSEIVAETLMRPARKFHLTRTYFKGFFRPASQPPDIVVLKECSSYFPGDMERYKFMFQEWVRMVRAKGTRVMVTTVVPVTKARAARDRGKQEGILEFNDWIRAYARDNGIVLLDLESALRTDGQARYLRDELTSGDGSHLNRKAYDILDRQMLRALCELGRGGDCTARSARVER